MRPEHRRRIRFTRNSLEAPVLALGGLLILIGLGTWLVNGLDTVSSNALVIGLLLFGACLAMDPGRVWRRIKRPSTLYSGNTSLMVVALAGIVGLLNVASNNHHQRWDLTANRQFSLSDESLRVLAGLPGPIQATAFFTSQDAGGRQDALDLLNEYQTRTNRKFVFEVVDPIIEPARAQQAGITHDETTVLTMGDRRQSVNGSTEQAFTTGIIKLVSPTLQKVYFTTGHNERNLDNADRDSYGQIKSSLEADNYIVDTLLLVGDRQIPTDATVVVISQPRNPFGVEEKAGIERYIDTGGRLMLLTQPNLPPGQPQVPLGDLVSRWGVEIGSTVVAEGDPLLAVQGEPLAPVMTRFPTQQITEKLGVVLVPTATYINYPKDFNPRVTYEALLQTSDRSWAETDAREVRFDEGSDPRGPFTLGLAIEAAPENTPPSTLPPGGQLSTRKARVVIFGDADFAANAYLQLAAGNRDLFINSVNWLAEEEQLISIQPKPIDNRSMVLSATQANLLLVSSVLLLPLIVLGIGGLVWWSRR